MSIPYSPVASPTAAARPHPWSHTRSGWFQLPLATGFAVVVLWALAPALDLTKTLRPLVAVAAVLLAIAMLVLAARHTAGRERMGWTLAVVGAVGTMLPLIGSVAGIVMSVGVLLIAGGGWLSDRHRLLDGAVAFATLATGAAAYLYPEVLERHGVQRVDGVIGATQIVLAFSVILLMTYRCRAAARPDAWLVAAGFVAGTVAGMPGLVATDANHASTWIPTRWWEIALPLAAVAIAAGARLRVARPEPQLDAVGWGSEPNAALIGDLCLAALIVAFVLTRPAYQAVTLPLLVAALLLRHARSRLVERDNARLQEAAVEAAEHRLALYRASFVALATAIEARDGYTGQHSEQTVELVTRVAEALDLTGDEVSEVKTAALLHDVGKIGIPDDVLHKAGPLDEAEWEVMRRHPEIGERILRAVPGLDGVARAVRHEHERWDGGGYPDRLAGEQIPLASRIVLVCDAFHAMTSDRPYRTRMTEAAALAELRRCAGSQFDPRVVEALETALNGRHL
jgi:hypothetical protein